MLQLKKILVPIDFSEFTSKALEHGREFAKTFDAELLLCHVLELPFYPVAIGMGSGPPPILFDDLLPEIEKRLVALEQELLESGLRATHEVVEGKPFVEIVRLAREQKIDLIIMPTHGRTGLSHMIIGSTAERVVRKAPCPVLVLRDDQRQFVHP